MQTSDRIYASTYSWFLFMIVVVLAVFFGGGGALGLIKSGSIISVSWIVSMLPYVLLGYGLLMSFLTLELRFLIPSAIGSSALGLSMLGSMVFGKFLPGLVAVTSSILTYYTYDYMVQNAGFGIFKNIMAGILSTLILLAQVLSTKPAAPGTYMFDTSLLSDGLGTMFGISIGLAGWFIVSLSYPNSLPYTGYREEIKLPAAPMPVATSGSPT